MGPQPVLSQVNLVVSDMPATIAFYRRLGLVVAAEPGAQHVAAQMPNGMLIEWDSTQFVRQWDSGWDGSTGGSAVLGFSVSSRDAVDEIYADLTRAGYQGHQQPYDAFWGARYAIVTDPDGNCVALMSPIGTEHKHRPPQAPPAGS